jgi:hypothetical protein
MAFIDPSGRSDSQEVLRFDDEAPTGPNRAGACKGNVLCEGEVLGGAREVTDTRQDD